MTSAFIFNADDGVQPTGLAFTQLLSQRDVSIKIPINHVPVPGVALTAACFPDRQYALQAGIKCFSNLLAVGFRRFELDLFWDARRETWSLCPAELSEAQAGGSSSRTTTSPPARSTTASLASGQLSEQSDIAVSSTPAALVLLRPRQTTLASSETLARSTGQTPSTTSIASSTTSSASEAQSTIGSAPTQTTLSGAVSDDTLTQVGAYRCSPELTFDALLVVLNGHLDNTEDTLNATTKYLSLNLHLAQSTTDTNATSSSSVEVQPESLSALIASNNSQWLYTPESLRNQRNNLLAVGSWFQVATQYVPTRGYFRIDNIDAVASSADGWPSESFVELGSSKRFLVGFGRVDSALASYNFTADDATLFTSGYLDDIRQTTVSSTGQLSEGCFFNSQDATLQAANSSWSVSGVGVSSQIDSSSYAALLTAAGQLTSCGISPILNTTLLNKTADQDYTPYKEYVESTIWSWTSDEPRNVSMTEDGQIGRCAALNVSSSRWQTEDCSNTHHSACRVSVLPYQYSISDDSIPYERADEACPRNSSFAVPRTGLENAYLLSTYKTYRDGRGSAIEDPSDQLLWINFNDLDAEGCWVIGVNTTCPYRPQDQGSGRTIVVPTVAAVIVLVIALAVIVIKVAANRRTTRRKTRRGDDGWDYEGVPS